MDRITSLYECLAFQRSGWLLELLDAGRLTSHFQPIVAAAGPDSVFGYEALMRGLDGDGRLFPAGRILDGARDAGVLFPLDLAARKSAIRQARAHDVADHLFINFTPNAIYDPTYCLRSTLRAVEDSRLSPERLVFEVTKAEEIKDTGALERILAVYPAAGCKVALDDLGSGYSSLNLLHQIKPDFIKLDMLLVRDVDRQPYKAAVAAKILEMAHDVGARTIAEGIETQGEFEWVREHGADYVQGYFIAKPSAAAATALA